MRFTEQNIRSKSGFENPVGFAHSACGQDGELRVGTAELYTGPKELIERRASAGNNSTHKQQFHKETVQTYQEKPRWHVSSPLLS